MRLAQRDRAGIRDSRIWFELFNASIEAPGIRAHSQWPRSAPGGAGASRAGPNIHCHQDGALQVPAGTTCPTCLKRQM